MPNNSFGNCDLISINVYRQGSHRQCSIVWPFHNDRANVTLVPVECTHERKLDTILVQYSPAAILDRPTARVGAVEVAAGVGTEGAWCGGGAPGAGAAPPRLPPRPPRPRPRLPGSSPRPRWPGLPLLGAVRGGILVKSKGKMMT